MQELSDKFKSGFVALLGRPNAGKSTLLNKIAGKKVAITSNVVQTTRHRVSAILNKPNLQAIFVDTPGLHKPKDVLGQELNASVFQATNDVDLIAVLFDVSKKIGAGDKWIVNKIKDINCPKICILSKCDLVNDIEKFAQVSCADKLLNWDALICLSAKDDYNIDAFISEVEQYLPYGPAWYPQNEYTDQSIDILAAEYVRERIIKNVYEEIPHSIGVELDDLYYDSKKKRYDIFVTAYVEKESQKGIVVGKDGKNIKKIGTEARADLEKLLNKHVFLSIDIKLKKNWRRDYNQVRRFGYTSE